MMRTRSWIGGLVTVIVAVVLMAVIVVLGRDPAPDAPDDGAEVGLGVPAATSLALGSRTTVEVPPAWTAAGIA